MPTGGGGVEIDRDRGLAEHADELVVDDLDDLLARRHRAGDLGADGALADLLDEGLHDLERDVGLEQRAADLAQRRVDVGLAEGAAAAQAIEDFPKPVAKAFEHSRFPSRMIARDMVLRQAKTKTHPRALRAVGW